MSTAWRLEGASRSPLKLQVGQLPNTQTRLRDPRGGCLKADTSEEQRRRDGVHRASGRVQPIPHGQVSRAGEPVGPGWLHARAQGQESRAEGPTLRTGQGEDNTRLSALCSLGPSPPERAEPSPPPPVAARPQRGGRSAWTDRLLPLASGCRKVALGTHRGPTARHFQSNRVDPRG